MVAFGLGILGVVWVVACFGFLGVVGLDFLGFGECHGCFLGVCLVLVCVLCVVGALWVVLGW